MEHKKFLEQYTDKFYNYDTVYGPECVDLFKGYYRDVKEYRINVSLGAAKNYWKYIEKAGFTRTTTPVQGDATFTNYTEWGHVGIFERFGTLKGVNGFYQFDQLGNGEKVGGEKPCKLRFYPMSKLFGFATINKTTMEKEMPIEELRTLHKKVKTRKFKDYSVDERIKILIDISNG